MIQIYTLADFAYWLAHGRERFCIYFTGGNLGEAQMEARKLADVVWKAAVNRDVYLLQRRCERDRSIEYLAIRPKNGKVPARFAADGVGGPGSPPLQ